MRRLRLPAIGLVAGVAGLAAMSGSAFAAEVPENLPVSTTRTFTSVSGTATTIVTLHATGQEPIRCTSAPGSGTETSSGSGTTNPEGAFHLTLTGCETESGLGKVKCTGLGDTPAGTILILGKWKLVWDRLKGGTFENLTTAILFLNELVHLTCGGLVLVEVLGHPASGTGGETLCLHLNPTVESTKHEFHCIGEIMSNGEPLPIEEYALTEKGTFTAPVLQASVSRGAAVAALWLGLWLLTDSSSLFAMQ